MATTEPTKITTPPTASTRPDVTTVRSRVVSDPTRETRSPTRRVSYSRIGSRSSRAVRVRRESRTTASAVRCNRYCCTPESSAPPSSSPPSSSTTPLSGRFSVTEVMIIDTTAG